MSGPGIHLHLVDVPTSNATGTSMWFNSTLNSEGGLYNKSSWKAYQPLTAVNVNGDASTFAEGLLYLPTLRAPNTPCGNSNDNFTVPGNFTTLSSFPPGRNYQLVAIFPWITSTCTQAYLAQAWADNVNAAVTFQLTGDKMLKHSDPSWQLSNYTLWNRFLVLAITESDAIPVLNSLAAWSGSMSQTPLGDALLQSNDPNDLPRIWAAISLEKPNYMPVWAIILVAFAGIILACAAFVWYAWVRQHRRRTSLQLRMQRGEVDLESLGIKRLNVPQEAINEMPKYTYTAAVVSNSVPNRPTTHRPESDTSQPRSVAEVFSSSSQLACPICLDDFTDNDTTVRELPCKHIFHPECIDLYLRDNSSLCPMCKKSALPPSEYAVLVTDAMVHRERLMRQMYERQRRALASFNASAGQPVVPLTGVDVEMAVLDNTSSDMPAQPVTTASGETVGQDVSARRIWHRERLARLHQQFFHEASEQTRLAMERPSSWQRITERIG